MPLGGATRPLGGNSFVQLRLTPRDIVSPLADGLPLAVPSGMHLRRKPGDIHNDPLSHLQGYYSTLGRCLTTRGAA